MELTSQQKKNINSGHFIPARYKDENVRVESYDKQGSLYIFIPSRQDYYWISDAKIESR